MVLAGDNRGAESQLGVITSVPFVSKAVTEIEI